MEKTICFMGLVFDPKRTQKAKMIRAVHHLVHRPRQRIGESYAEAVALVENTIPAYQSKPMWPRRKAKRREKPAVVTGHGTNDNGSGNRLVAVLLN